MSDPPLDVDRNCEGLVSSCAMCGLAGTHSCCSRCQCVRYCTTACQRAHWRSVHRVDCRVFVTALGPIDERMPDFLIAQSELVTTMFVLSTLEPKSVLEHGATLNDGATRVDSIVAAFADRCLSRGGVCVPIAHLLTTRQLWVFCHALAQWSKQEYFANKI